MNDEQTFEFGDVVDCNICTTPMSITIFGKLNGPEKYGDIYVGGNARTIGIELFELKKKPYAIAVAGGKEKLSAIYAGLLGRNFNVLITDEWVASEILSY